MYMKCTCMCGQGVKNISSSKQVMDTSRNFCDNLHVYMDTPQDKGGIFMLK